MATGQKTAETTGIGHPTVVEDTTDPVQLKDVSILDNLAEVKPHLEMFEYEDLTKQSNSLNVKGKLKRNIAFWHSIEATEFVLSVIKDGYCLPFETIPGSSILRNNRAAGLI